MWPDLETFKKIPFDYTIHDPKYEDASLICSKLQTINSEGLNSKNLDWYTYMYLFAFNVRILLNF